MDNQTLVGPDLKYICAHDTFHLLTPAQNVEVRLLNSEEVKHLYPDKRFRNAIGDKDNPKRPRVLAATALSGKELVGVAAAAADSDEMYQIGIDVIPDFRDVGIGTTLVSLLTKSILDMGKVPYYSTWANNIGSRRLASAVAAARNGTDTVLIERYGHLGGLASGGLVNIFPNLSTISGEQQIYGLNQELLDRLDARGGTSYPKKEDWGTTDEKVVNYYLNAHMGNFFIRNDPDIGKRRVMYSAVVDFISLITCPPEYFGRNLHSMCT